MIPVVDLHNDLLSFLAEKPGRTPFDLQSRSAFPQLSQGNVKLQTLAIYAETGKDSALKGKAQVDQYLRLLRDYPTYFAKKEGSFEEKRVQVLPAFENASALVSETEPLAVGIQRLEKYVHELGKIAYISLTWNEENRFGGGNATDVGLKEDGKRLLEWMSGKNIAIDLSHTSDQLAYGILEFIEQADLNIPVIASHSNYRAISGYPRNLPEEIAKEIIRRKGLIGLNFYAPFIHKTDPMALLRHVEYALDLGAHDVLCFGADFFYAEDYQALLAKYQITAPFYPGLSNASAYPYVLELFSKQLKLSQEQLHKIAYRNAVEFLKN